MSVRAERINGATTIRVSGELDLATADALAEPLFEALDAQRSVVLDLSRCTFMDSSGVMLLARAAAHAEGRLTAVCVPGQILRVLELTGCDRCLSLRVERPE